MNKNARFNKPGRNNNGNFRNYGNDKQRSYHNMNYNKNKTSHYNHNMDSSQTKENLIDYIYNNIDLSHFRYKLIEVESDLLNVKNKYVASPNYNGTNSLLVFIKLVGKYYSFLLDRKTLSYNRNQVDINNVHLTHVRIRLDQQIYDGTIMDGIVLHNQVDGKSVFIINDIYLFRGQNLIQTKMIYKEMNINAYLNSQMVEDSNMNNIKLVSNKLYKLSQIKNLVENEIDKLEFSDEVKGVSFYPELSGTKYIYLYNNVSYVKDNDKQQEKSEKHDKHEKYEKHNKNGKHEKDEKQLNSHQVLQQHYACQDKDEHNIEDGREGIFEMRVTDVSDVYKLHLLLKLNTGNNRTIKSKKIGIAYIPTNACSQMCNDILKDKNKVLVKCKYNKEKNKWVPIEQSNDRRPNYIDEIYK